MKNQKSCTCFRSTVSLDIHARSIDLAMMASGEKERAKTRAITHVKRYAKMLTHESVKRHLTTSQNCNKALVTVLKLDQEPCYSFMASSNVTVSMSFMCQNLLHMFLHELFNEFLRVY